MGRKFSLYHSFGHVGYAVLCVLLFLSVSWGGAYAGDWGTYRNDISRSGVTSESIDETTYLQWSYNPTHQPEPAWPMPAEEMQRNHSDNAYHVAIAAGKVYFGSSVTNEVRCIDAGSGQIDWEFYAEGPVRFAPTVSDGKVYFGSDDGYVYCLNAQSGKQQWKYRAGPSQEKVIGNGRMISLWPVRTSVLVDKGVAYFAAGVFPYEGIYICALNAQSGSVVWKNDTMGDRSHELQFGGISPQGYILASDDIVYVPSGRSMPVAFDRRTGSEMFVTRPPGKSGGTWALLDKDRLIAGVDASGTPKKTSYDARTGKRTGDAFGWFPGIDMVVTSEYSYVLTEAGVYAINRAHYSGSVAKVSEYSRQRKDLGKKLDGLKKKVKNAGTQQKEQITKQINDITKKIAKLTAGEKKARGESYKWRYDKEGLRSLILAGDVVLAGGAGHVTAINAKTGDEIWRHEIAGDAVGMAVSDGRLVVSSEEGPVYCFGSKKIAKATKISSAVSDSPYDKDSKAELFENAAKEIVDALEVKQGYCLVLDCGDGRLAYELANRTEMKIVGLERDARKVKLAREKLAKAGLLGKRVVVESWDIDDLPSYFANLIVSDGMLRTGKTLASKEQIGRVLRPYGGICMLGKTGFLSSKIKWQKTVRGKLEGDGEWTHQYANSQNTASSGDELVSGRLGMLWFGEPGPQDMVDRHAKVASPLAKDGRMFVQGEEMVLACDSYNGTLLWKRRIPGAVRIRADVDSSNMTVSDDGLFIAAYDKCYKLDPATGKTLKVFDVPGKAKGEAYRWGYISVVGDVLYGSAGKPLNQEYASKYKTNYPDGDEEVRWAYQRAGTHWHSVADFPSWENYLPCEGAKTSRTMVSDVLFAINAKTGSTLWTHKGSQIANIAITIADGNVLLTDADVDAGQRDAAFAARKELTAKGVYETAEKFKVNDKDRDVRIVSCLNAKTGKEIWSKPVDLTGCCGDTLASAVSNDILLLFGSVGSHDMWRFQRGQIEYRRVVAMNVDDGKMVWSKPHNYMTRPIILDDMVIVEPWACDLKTGKQKTRLHPVTGEEVAWQFLRPGHTCSMTAASANSLFYRSCSTAMYNLKEDRGVTLFGGYRPGCWLTVIPANGLVLSPEASSGCTCSFPIRCSFALTRKPNREKPYAVFITPESTKTVKHLALNFGAPADMKDDDGVVWFGYPGPNNGWDPHIHFANYGVTFKLNEQILDGMGYFSGDHRGVSFVGTDKPWLFTSGCVGLSKMTIPLVKGADRSQSATYTVRLGFKALGQDKTGRRIFDIKLQGKTVVKDFDIARAAGAKIAIKEFADIAVSKDLTVELVCRAGDPAVDQAPVLNFIEIIRQDSKAKPVASSGSF